MSLRLKLPLVSFIEESFWRVRYLSTSTCTAKPSRLQNYKQPQTNSHTAEDNMNVQLKDITVTARDGRVSHLDQVYIRGSHVRFFIVPDMLRYCHHPRFISSISVTIANLAHAETPRCSAREASAAEVSVLRVVRPRCRGRGGRGGVDPGAIFRGFTSYFRLVISVVSYHIISI